MDDGVETLQLILSQILGHLKAQYSGTVAVDVYACGRMCYKIVLQLVKGINFDDLQHLVNTGNEMYAIRPDCTNFGGHEKGTVPFFLDIKDVV